MDCVTPAKITLPFEAVNVPVFAQLPVSVIELFAVCVSVPFAPMVTSPDTVRFLLLVPSLSVQTFAAAPRVRDLQVEAEEIRGWNEPVKLASPIIASTVAVGTPLVQFAAVLHAVLDVPFQDVCAVACCSNNATSML